MIMWTSTHYISTWYEYLLCDSAKSVLSWCQSVWLVCQVESAIQLLRGRIYEAMDNRSQAVQCYRAALVLDVRCFEAFECLVQHHMMSAAEGEVISDFFESVYNVYLYAITQKLWTDFDGNDRRSKWLVFCGNLNFFHTLWVIQGFFTSKRCA